jgi:hypothetical protein
MVVDLPSLHHIHNVRFALDNSVTIKLACTKGSQPARMFLQSFHADLHQKLFSPTHCSAAEHVCRVTDGSEKWLCMQQVVMSERRWNVHSGLPQTDGSVLGSRRYLACHFAEINTVHTALQDAQKSAIAVEEMKQTCRKEAAASMVAGGEGATTLSCSPEQIISSRFYGQYKKSVYSSHLGKHPMHSCGSNYTARHHRA